MIWSLRKPWSLVAAISCKAISLALQFHWKIWWNSFSKIPCKEHIYARKRTEDPEAIGRKSHPVHLDERADFLPRICIRLIDSSCFLTLILLATSNLWNLIEQDRWQCYVCSIARSQGWVRLCVYRSNTVSKLQDVFCIPPNPPTRLGKHLGVD